jgi:hypothetical protein
MKSNSIHELKREINKSRRVAFFLIAFFVIGYGIWFYFVNDYRLSLDTSAWGEFGDFIGGLLNPAIAYLVFWWFTKSILIQKEELENTRLAFEEQVNLQKRDNVRVQLTELIAKEKNLLNEYLSSHFAPFQIEVEELGIIGISSFSQLKSLYKDQPLKKSIIQSYLNEQMRTFYSDNENLTKYNELINKIRESVLDIFEYIIIYSDVNDLHRLNINELNYLSDIIYKSPESGAIDIRSTSEYIEIINEKTITSEHRHKIFLEFLNTKIISNKEKSS